jgi:SLAP domain-containing protein
MMKRLWFSFGIALLLALPVSDASAASAFSDVDSHYWAYNEIHYLSDKQIIRGRDGKFYPEEPLKRMQAAEMLVKALQLSVENRPNPNFKDIKPGDYGYEYAAALADEGIMTGSNGYFMPWGTLTRGQMAKILSEAYDLMYIFGTHFDDVDIDSPWYDYVSCLTNNYITTGYEDNTYRPNAPLKRSQFSAFMARVLHNSFKPAVLLKPSGYHWDKDGGLIISAEVTNNFSYPVKVTDALIAVTANGRVVAEDWFEIASDQLSLASKQSEQIQLYFPPDRVYIKDADLTNMKLFSQAEWIKK